MSTSDSQDSTECVASCVLCGSDIIGEVQGISLTICCRDCCVQEKHQFTPAHGNGYCVSKNQAMRYYGKNILRSGRLQCKTIERDGNDMHLYLYKEVETLLLGAVNRRWFDRAKRKGKVYMLDEEDLENLKHEAEKRKAELEAEMQVNLEELDPFWCHFLLRDYLSLLPTITLEAACERVRVYDRARQIRAECVTAHPEAAIDFCLEHPEGGPDEFRQLKEKILSVFELEGARILYNIPREKRYDLQETSLADVFAEFQKRDSKTLIRSHLEKLVGSKVAAEIMEHPSCELRLDIGGFEPKVAEKLAEFWKEKDDVEKRTRRVKEALQLHGQSFREDCFLCEDYVNGDLDCDVEDVVAAVVLMEAGEAIGLGDVFPDGPDEVALDEFCYCFRDKGMDFDDSLDRAIDYVGRCDFGIFYEESSDDSSSTDDSLSTEDSSD